MGTAIARTNIAFAGLTSAGKTTHARILAERLGYRYVSATEVMPNILGLRTDDPERVRLDHKDAIEKARAYDRLDEELEAGLLELAATEDGLVLDTWPMAWICNTPLIRIWLDSDRLSRHWKCHVAQACGSGAGLTECIDLIDRKDTSRRLGFLRRHGFDLFSDNDVFDAILTNTWAITEPTQAAVERGIEAFDPVVLSVATHLLSEGACGSLESDLDRAGSVESKSVIRIREVAYAGHLDQLKSI